MFKASLFKKFSKDPIIISSSGKKYNYGEVFNFAQFVGEKIEPRSLVFCLSNNTVGSLIGYISFLHNKIVPVMLSADIQLTSLERLIKDYRPEYIWIPTKLSSYFSNYDQILDLDHYCLIRFKNKENYLLNNKLSLLLTTSGSTGNPKFVRLSYENIISNAESIAKYLSIDSYQRPITALPMSYSFGLSIINSHIIKGCTILLTDDSIAQKGFWSFMKLQKATSFSGVPFTFEMLKKIRFFKMKLPDLEIVTQAGGKLDNSLIKEFSNHFLKSKIQFFVMYGQTEAAPRMSYLHPNFSVDKLGSIGKAIPGGKFWLLDKNKKQICDPNIKGDLYYSGPNVSMGYAEKRKHLSIDDMNKGVLDTGDVAIRDEDGFYYVVGRKKRFIKLFSKRINLDFTEKIVAEHFGSCACTGTDDKMVIYLTDSTVLQDVKDFLAENIGVNKSAFLVKYIKEIPKSKSGKTLYSFLN